MADSRFSKRQLADCAMREVKLRERVYLNRVYTRRMSQQKADLEIAMMRAIAAHFLDLAEPDAKQPELQL